METFSALLVICAGNSLLTGECLAQMPLTRSFGVFSNLRFNRQLSKLWGRWWFETPSNPSWRHRNDTWRIPDMTNITEKGSSKVQVITGVFSIQYQAVSCTNIEWFSSDVRLINIKISVIKIRRSNHNHIFIIGIVYRERWTEALDLWKCCPSDRLMLCLLRDCVCLLSHV